jgi:hypothetical protein
MTGEEVEDRAVGLALFGGLSDRDFEGAGLFSSNGIGTSARLCADADDDSV